MNLLALASVGCGLLLLPLLSPSQPETTFPAGGRYIGAAMCKNCHNGADKGDAYDHWSKTEHAKAFETLASDKAKEVAKQLGIEDPQKSEKCLKCHVTAYGVDKKEIKASFKAEMGVQCESCHGPGEDHQKKRFAEAMKPGTTPSEITADEIHASRSIDTCGKCHNKESPTYKPFCLKERMQKIEHLDPRKKRTDEELAKLRATDGPDCEVCGATKDAAAKKEGADK
ncbi:MAG: hypothetical protein JNM25_08360 [Planctomycetes bacterium]|nr:hypothetical protein [Planctomycetota bacterium]